MFEKIKKKLTKKNLVVFSFLSVPFLSSVISTFHLIRFFVLGNPDWMSSVLAITYEVGSLSVMVGLSVLKYINKSMVWSIFLILFFIQMLGNVYFSFDFINIALSSNSSWLTNFIEFYKTLYGFAGDSSELQLSTIKMVLSLLIGLPVPIISIMFTKSLIQYIEKIEDLQHEKDKTRVFIEVKEEDLLNDPSLHGEVLKVTKEMTVETVPEEIQIKKEKEILEEIPITTEEPTPIVNEENVDVKVQENTIEEKLVAETEQKTKKEDVEINKKKESFIVRPKLKTGVTINFD